MVHSALLSCLPRMKETVLRFPGRVEATAIASISESVGKVMLIAQACRSDHGIVVEEGVKTKSDASLLGMMEDFSGSILSTMLTVTSALSVEGQEVSLRVIDERFFVYNTFLIVYST